MAILSGLKPERVFSYFEELSRVPRGSGNTAGASNLCAAYARQLGLRCRQDAANNVIIWKDASPGYEGAAPIILQGHLDMVCAKTEDCTKDMATQGLDLVTDGEWIWADKTSLGADNGVAIAIILAILTDDTLPHPPIEAVFTADEEIGLVGAFALDCSDLRGRTLLNLDFEDEGVFTVSSAGGVSLDCALAAAREPLDGECCYEIVLDGLIGGHSGADIDKGRASANPLMVRVLYSAMEQIPLLRLCDIHGGQFDNVISPSCRAKIAVPHEQAQALEQFLASFGGVLKNEWACEPELSLSWNAAAPSDALSVRDTSRALHLLLGLPHGVQAMSMEFPGLVQTSLNFSFVCLEPDGLRFTCSIRSCIASQKAMMVQRVRAAVESAGGSVAERSDYPGWQYAKSSALRELILSAYRDISGREGRVVASHGGLECGLFVDRIPGLDAISTGPDLQGVHSVHERVSVRSIAHLYDLVCEVLKRSR